MMLFGNLQITADIDDHIQHIQQVEPYILLSIGEGSFQFFVVAEKQIFCVLHRCCQGLICSLLIFLQRFVLDIKDSQRIPDF